MSFLLIMQSLNEQELANTPLPCVVTVDDAAPAYGALLAVPTTCGRQDAVRSVGLETLRKPRSPNPFARPRPPGVAMPDPSTPSPERTVAIACDHAGVALKHALKRDLAANGYSVLDLGTDGTQSVDYPDFADALAAAIAEGRARQGVLVCGTGIGISIAANRNPAVRAAVVHDVETARLSRAHNDANVLALGARVTPEAQARDCLAVFLTTPYEGGRHENRVAKLGPRHSPNLSVPARQAGG
jgi:ribose 5-phosphate isomerase B